MAEVHFPEDEGILQIEQFGVHTQDDGYLIQFVDILGVYAMGWKWRQLWTKGKTMFLSTCCPGNGQILIEFNSKGLGGFTSRHIEDNAESNNLLSEEFVRLLFTTNFS